MKVLIIEDEKPAAKRLEQLLKGYNSNIEILDKIDSVKNAISWFRSSEINLDLIFMDIQLADGLSFEIFEHVSISIPVIFTTAYDEYALKAFKVNSIDYLLKPIDKDDLTQAFEKWEKLSESNSDNILKKINSTIEMLANKYKSRFIIKTGEHIRSVATDDILYFFSREKASFCHMVDHKNYLLDYPLDHLERMVDPENFFRINRKYLISIASFHDIISYSNSRLKVILYGSDDNDVIVSRDRVADFKTWLDK